MLGQWNGHRFFWTPFQRHRKQEAKTDKWNYIKLKSFGKIKKIIKNRLIRAYRLRENIVNHSSDKRLVSKIYKEQENKMNAFLNV
jgi:hypothetical protein